jgi:hypothetical protein
MHFRILATFTCLSAAMFAGVNIAAERPARQAKAQSASARSVPRTSDGHTDLEGVWANNTVTPFERPKELVGKESLTDEELSVLKQRAARLFDGGGDTAIGDELFLALLANPEQHKRRGTGDYNQFWTDTDLVFEKRTAQVFEPRDGRLPPLTPQAQLRQAAAAEERRLHPADGPENRTPLERCITHGAARIGFLHARNNSYYQIVQTRDFVVIHAEMIHEARVIPMDGRPHISPEIRSWLGDSRGHWEGETLVIDTTNFSPKSNFSWASSSPASLTMGSHEHLHLIERLTRTDLDTLQYEVTADDPTTWTQPWKAMVPWKRSTDRIYEYACHEGNRSMEGILSGARADEKAAAEASKK